MKAKSILYSALLISSLALAQLKPVEYSDQSQNLSGFSGTPKKALAGKPGILILPAWMGIDDHAKESAEQLQNMGYYTFVADIYGVDQRPKDYKEAGQKAGYYKKNILEYQKRIQLAYDQLIRLGASKDKIVVMGYCFGGTGALEAARMNLPIAAAVSFHGGLGHDASRTIAPIKARVLVLHGADDPYVPKEEVASFQDEMRQAKADWEMIYYANAVHSFTDKGAGTDNSKGAAYNEKADQRSWEAFKQLLNDLFQ
ncbi:MAG: hypothetical protein RLZZ500_415 [Bacteroidota bacterium]|jgi:dienelactone hydrolase